MKEQPNTQTDPAHNNITTHDAHCWMVAKQCFPMILPGGAAIDVVAYPEELGETGDKGQAAGAAFTRDAL